MQALSSRHAHQTAQEREGGDGKVYKVRAAMETKLVQTSIKKLVGIRAMLTSLLVALTSAVADLPEMYIKRRRAYAHIVAILVIIIIILIVLIILTI